MNALPQNNNPHSPIASYCATCPKIYAAIHYERHSSHSSGDDGAFGFAADTFLEKIKENSYTGYDFDFAYSGIDNLIKLKFHDEASFIEAWNVIRDLSQANESRVACMAIFTHHGGAGQSHIGGWRPGAVTEDDGDLQDEWNISGKEISGLDKLHWLEGKSFIFMANCNGDEGTGSVAEAMHTKQSVKVYYSRAYSYFSNDYLEFDRSMRLKLGIASASNVGDLYLLAFERGSHNENDPDVMNFGSGVRVWEGIYE